MQHLIRSNVWKLYAGTILKELIFFIPIMVPFFGSFGLSMQEIFIVEIGFSGMLVLLEIPSGYFADLFGRKLSLVIGSLVELIGITVFIFSGGFWWFLIGEIMMGIGASFVSGAEEAILYETLEECGDGSYRKVQGNMFFYSRISGVFANLVGAAMAAMFLRLPFYVTLVPFVAWVLVCLSLREPRVYKENFERWGHFKKILRESLVENKKLRYFIIYSAIPPAFFLMTFWMYQSYMEFVELPIVWFGVVIAGMNVFSGLGSKYAKEVEDFLTPKLSLMIVPVLAILSWLILASFRSFWVLPIIVVPAFLWGFLMPVVTDFVQKMATSDRRSTILSVRSFLTRILFVGIAPVLGLAVDVWSVQMAFILAASGVFVLSALSLLMLRVVKVL